MSLEIRQTFSFTFHAVVCCEKERQKNQEKKIDTIEAASVVWIEMLTYSIVESPEIRAAAEKNIRETSWMKSLNWY